VSDMSKNVETMMYHGKRPWHGLGVALDHPADSAAAIRAAGLDWRVELFTASAVGEPIPGALGVVRMDRREPIAVVGERYVPIQNVEAFAFFDHLIGEGHAVYETAGALDRGRRIWLLARLPGELWVTREDNVGKYLLLANSHDGKSPLRALFTPIRVVCENTLRAALSEGQSSGIRIRHVGDIRDKVQEAQRLLGISIKYYDTFAEQAGAMAGRSLRREALDGYFKSLVPDPREVDPSHAAATRQTLVRLFETGKGNALPTVRGSLWAALNAVSELVDHERPVRVKPGESEALHRWKSAQFGSGAVLKEHAWSQALMILGREERRS
jgi:phage/plasmid-like protein (TIGR03299 family)